MNKINFSFAPKTLTQILDVKILCVESAGTLLTIESNLKCAEKKQKIECNF